MGKTILVVEDEAPLRHALVEKLKHEGYTVYGATNGEEGLDAAGAHNPALIFLDLMMPKMDGMTMLQKLRQQPWGQDTPVIILTNLSDSEKVQQAVEHEVFDFLVKSNWKLEDVVAKVQEKIGPADQAAE